MRKPTTTTTTTPAGDGKAALAGTPRPVVEPIRKPDAGTAAAWMERAPLRWPLGSDEQIAALVNQYAAEAAFYEFECLPSTVAKWREEEEATRPQKQTPAAPQQADAPAPATPQSDAPRADSPVHTGPPAPAPAKQATSAPPPPQLPTLPTSRAHAAVAASAPRKEEEGYGVVVLRRLIHLLGKDGVKKLVDAL